MGLLFKKTLTEKGIAALNYIINKYLAHTIDYTIAAYEEIIDGVINICDETPEIYPIGMTEDKKRDFAAREYLRFTLREINRKQRKEFMKKIEATYND